MSAWVQHCKDYASQKEIKYTEAMKSQECKELYHKNKQPIDKEKINEMTRPKVEMTRPKSSKTTKSSVIAIENTKEVLKTPRKPTLKKYKNEEIPKEVNVVDSTVTNTKSKKKK